MSTVTFSNRVTGQLSWRSGVLVWNCWSSFANRIPLSRRDHSSWGRDNRRNLHPRQLTSSSWLLSGNNTPGNDYAEIRYNPLLSTFSSSSIPTKLSPIVRNCDKWATSHKCNCEYCNRGYDRSVSATNSSIINTAQQQRRHFCVGRQAVNSSSGGGRSHRTTTLSLFGGAIMTTQPLTVCVEGNIGSGKTTFLKHFKNNPEVCVFDEPISKWRDCQGFNLLDLMYKDPQKWSLCFQSYVQLTMLDLHSKQVVQPIKMMERSIYSAQYCFVKNLRDEGLMEEAQYTVLSEWFNFATTNLPIKLDLIVYLRTDPEVAYQRIAERGRSEENSIKLEYLQSVHELHENWLVRNQKLLPCPVLTIDANLELENMAPNYLLCEERLFQKPAVANC